MRKIVAGLFMSLDGIVDAHEISPHEWTTDEMMERMGKGLGQADAVLFGSRTYALLERFWRHQSDDSPMANFLNRSTKYVVSSKLDRLDWQPATLIRGELIEEIAKLKSGPGRNIQIPGSPMLVRALLREGLLDELILNVVPVVVGSGARLFEDFAEPVRLRLERSTAFSNGVVSLTYRSVAPAAE
ncbi:dihydrofolate reductase family protein [Cohnella suwonensis]|uniref:Dihydrofolate reductase family protein n=1 Tax=Cohnella suwonensis TaxID=696072 RepID=A0ABW0LT88_9BACL